MSKTYQSESESDGVIQLYTYRSVERYIASKDTLFLKFVADGLTSRELSRLIEIRPALWARYHAWVKVLP